jgi:hypothetical protein
MSKPPKGMKDLGDYWLDSANKLSKTQSSISQGSGTFIGISKKDKKVNVAIKALIVYQSPAELDLTTGRLTWTVSAKPQCQQHLLSFIKSPSEIFLVQNLLPNALPLDQFILKHGPLTQHLKIPEIIETIVNLLTGLNAYAQQGFMHYEFIPKHFTVWHETPKESGGFWKAAVKAPTYVFIFQEKN